jgi:hypothetical protein
MKLIHYCVLHHLICSICQESMCTLTCHKLNDVVKSLHFFLFIMCHSTNNLMEFGNILLSDLIACCMFFNFCCVALVCVYLLDGYYLTCLAIRYVKLHMSTLVVVGGYLSINARLAWLLDLGIFFLGFQ